eukprot:2756522-Rhodomonas_salina.2
MSLYMVALPAQKAAARREEHLGRVRAEFGDEVLALLQERVDELLPFALRRDDWRREPRLFEQRRHLAPPTLT